jgi:hypothetical protein
MGKRSEFERIPADRYPTPRPAVLPLVPHICGIREYAEPCDGGDDDDGRALIRHLREFDLTCVYAGDIRTGQDARALTAENCDGAPIITNPPHTRPLMHELIEHFQRVAPFCWLLIDYDWAATKQATPFLPHCSDIVVIGRVKWMPGSKFTGKDNFAWYRFAADHEGGTILHARGAVPEWWPQISLCDQPGAALSPGGTP